MTQTLTYLFASMAIIAVEEFCVENHDACTLPPGYTPRRLPHQVLALGPIEIDLEWLLSNNETNNFSVSPRLCDGIVVGLEHLMLPSPQCVIICTQCLVMFSLLSFTTKPIVLYCFCCHLVRRPTGYAGPGIWESGRA
jgi:hypothetical protein